MTVAPLSPLDGRYAKSLDLLRPFLSEEALFRARVDIELRYFVALSRLKNVREFPAIKPALENQLMDIVHHFNEKDVARIRAIEKTTRHDVKAVEYYLREKVLKIKKLKPYAEFIHFGLTSEDVNNLSYGILVHGALQEVILPELQELHKDLKAHARENVKIKMLSLTHGQPATPTTLGKEIAVFADRLERQIAQIKTFRMQGKLGGAVGNFSAHNVAYPDVKWEKFRDAFVKSLGLEPLTNTTQINPHDDIAELSHILIRVNTILLDLSRDAWLYISRGVFAQKVVKGEVGSSAMPHKVNPIDFENGEGNLGLSTALFGHFAEKLPVSRLQRDLSDSTVQRNIGVAFGYHLLAVLSIRKGLSKISVNRSKVREELDLHPEVGAEAVQTMLRKRKVPGGYEKLKALTRGERITRADLLAFLESLDLPKDDRDRLRLML
jgi:adenylosuccinate lyase